MRLHSTLGFALLVICALGWTSLVAQHQVPLAELVAVAEDGDATAQYLVALRYGNGEGVERDPERALEWMTRAADNGHLEAQAGLGVYFTSEGQTQENRDNAMLWLQRAAERRHAMAAVQLGVISVGAGQGKKALRWFRIAADSGDKDLQLAFSDMLEKGDGVPLDLAEAYYWSVVASGDEGVEPVTQTALGNRLGAKAMDEIRARAEVWRAKLPDSEPVAGGDASPLAGPMPKSPLDSVTEPAAEAATGFVEIRFWDQREEGDERPPVARRERYTLRDAIAFRESQTVESGTETYTVLEIDISPIDRALLAAELRDGRRRGPSAGLILHLQDAGSLKSGLIAHSEGYHEISPDVVASDLSITASSVTGRFRTTAPESESDWRNYRFDVRINADLIERGDSVDNKQH